MTQKQQQQQTEQPVVTGSESEKEGMKTETSERMQTTARPETRTGGIQRTSRGGLGRAELLTSPFAIMQRMMNEMDRMFSRFGFGGGIMPTGAFDLVGEETWSPVIETFEREGKLVLRADLPGLAQKDVKVEVVDDQLVISGKREHEEQRTEGGRFYSERRYGSFERRMGLPQNCKPEDIEASFENGVLEVNICAPEEEPKAKTIEVKSGHGGGSSPPQSVH